MILASPLWLLALIPWAALTLWLLIGRNPRVVVPFVGLWRDTDAPVRRVSGALQRPPAALACALLAILLALIAAARPALVREREPLRVIVDRGVTMSGRSPDDRAWESILAELNASEVIAVPSGDLEPTSANTRDELVARVKTESMSRGVVVISNQDLGAREFDAQVIQISPHIPANVGVVRVAIREDPKPALMVTVRNQSESRIARIGVTNTLAAEAAGPVSVSQREVELPRRDGERDYFFELDRAGDVILVEVVVDDGLKADNRAFLLREKSSPVIEVRSTASPELARMIEIYSRHRKPSDRSSRIVVVDDVLRLSAKESGVVIVTGGAKMNAQPPMRLSDHPITAHVRDWNSLRDDAAVARPPGQGWMPLVQAGDHVLVAVRDHPVRRAWIGFNSGAFARSTDFVVFWTDVFDWIGGSGGTEFRTEPVVALDSNWQRLEELSGPAPTASPAPGVYRGPDGQLRAMSALDVKFVPPPSPIAWREKLAAISRDPTAGSATDLARPLILIAMALLALAAVLWNGRRSPKLATATLDRTQSVPSKPLA